MPPDLDASDITVDLSTLSSIWDRTPLLLRLSPSVDVLQETGDWPEQDTGEDAIDLALLSLDLEGLPLLLHYNPPEDVLKETGDWPGPLEATMQVSSPTSTSAATVCAAVAHSLELRAPK
ncbi:hypothetical protein K523DRAFT_358521 [Schizophyllum commune Tattone D]|nr:hypothetical protein K523DRAFT_358521 [Schizophyllum commune Tattone D]